MSRPDLAQLRAAVSRGVNEAAEHVLKAAQENVPVEDGDLRDSGEVTMSGTTATVAFTAPYSKKQHEDMRLRHPNGGGPKYLERALAGERDQVRTIIATHLRRALGG